MEASKYHCNIVGLHIIVYPHPCDLILSQMKSWSWWGSCSSFVRQNEGHDRRELQRCWTNHWLSWWVLSRKPQVPLFQLREVYNQHEICDYKILAVKQTSGTELSRQKRVRIFVTWLLPPISTLKKSPELCDSKRSSEPHFLASSSIL